MRKLTFFFSIILFCSFKTDTINNSLSADFKGNHHDFSGLKFIYFNPETNAALFGGVIDSTLSPEYSLEISTFKKIPGIYSFGLYANINLTRKYKINTMDTIITYSGTNGNLNITYFDTVNQIIQGNFDCLVVDYFTGDTINIKNGNFSITQPN